MDWESLLDELWSYVASEPSDLASKIRLCLKGHSSEGLLEALSLLIAQGQHTTAKTLLSDFLKNHQAVREIQRRLELVLHFKKHREPQAQSFRSKQRGKEALLREANELVASAKLQAAESLLLAAIESSEEPDYLNVLSRIYMMQRRPVEGAKAMQRSMQLKRQQQAFAEPALMETQPDGLPTADDLAYLNSSAEILTPLDDAPLSPCATLAGETQDPMSFIQDTSFSYPELNEGNWWETQSASPSPTLVTGLAEPQTPESSSEVEARPALEWEQAPTGSEPAAEASNSASTKPILRLALPRRTATADAETNKVKVVTRASRASAVAPSVAASEALTAPNSSSAVTVSPEPVEPSAQAPAAPRDAMELEQDEDLLLPDVLELNVPIQNDRGFGLDDLDVESELDHDLQGMSIIEPEEEYEEETLNAQDDFRDLDDDYAAYAFDPDEVFDSDEYMANEPDDWLADRLSREDRALQKAAELVGQAGWPHSTLPLVQQIFVMSGWGATRLALEREIEKGVTPDELILAAHIKVIWSENDIYWIAFDKTGSSRLSHHVLSWPTALLVVRSFESLPQIEEIEVFLEELFASWYENTNLRRSFKAFARYLWFRLSNLQGCLPANQPFDFCDPSKLPAEEYSDLGLHDLLEIERTALLRAYGVFQTKHPQEPGCYFSDKPAAEEDKDCNAPAEKEEPAEALPSAEEDAGTVAVDEIPSDDNEVAAASQWSAPPLPSALRAKADPSLYRPDFAKN